MSCEARFGKASGRRTDHIWLKRNLERHRDAAIEDEEGQGHVPSRAEARVGLDHWEAHGGTAPLERLELLRDHLIRQRSGRQRVSTARVTIGGNQGDHQRGSSHMFEYELLEARRIARRVTRNGPSSFPIRPAATISVSRGLRLPPHLDVHLALCVQASGQIPPARSCPWARRSAPSARRASPPPSPPPLRPPRLPRPPSRRSPRRPT